MVRAVPARSRIFENLGIDYCCGGKKPLAEVCRAKGLDPATVVAMLTALDGVSDASSANPDAMGLAELRDYVLSTMPRHPDEALEHTDRIRIDGHTAFIQYRTTLHGGEGLVSFRTAEAITVRDGLIWRVNEYASLVHEGPDARAPIQSSAAISTNSNRSSSAQPVLLVVIGPLPQIRYSAGRGRPTSR